MMMGFSEWWDTPKNQNIHFFGKNMLMKFRKYLTGASLWLLVDCDDKRQMFIQLRLKKYTSQFALYA